MPKVQDIKQYWKELASKNGLDEDTTKQLLEVLDKEPVQKAFTSGFKPLPDYSYDLDQVREKTRAEKDAEQKEWYDKVNAQYQQYVDGLSEMEKLRQQYAGTTPNQNPNGGGEVLTKEEIAQLMEAQLQEKLSRRDAAYMDLLEVREQHLQTFKKPLDVKAFEAAWKEHPEWGGSMSAAYRLYTEPEMNKIRESEWEAKIKQAREEGIRDGFSRRALPTDHEPKSFSPIFDRKEDVAKLDERSQEQHSRSAFFEGLREKQST